MSKNVFSCLAKLWKGFCPGGNDMYEYTQQKYTGFWGLNYTFEFYCLGFIFQVSSTCPPCSNLSWNLFRGFWGRQFRELLKLLPMFEMDFTLGPIQKSHCILSSLHVCLSGPSTTSTDTFNLHLSTWALKILST